MGKAKSYHSVCRWTFHAGRGGFLPAGVRPAWAADRFKVEDLIELLNKKLKPRLPRHIELGFELHYDTEVHEGNAASIADALCSTGIALAMMTPGAHSHFAYGGICSLSKAERAEAGKLGRGTVDLTYGPLRKAWHKDPQLAPTLVLWNGSYGYDLATIAVKQMYSFLKESIAELCSYEKERGGLLYFGLEPKPNEGHPAMLLPTVASALLLWRKLEGEYQIPRARKGLNMEIGHSEMIGLDHVYDTVEQLDDNAMVHIHLNSQGYNDGLILGGPGKYDIDHGARINGMNIAIAGLMGSAGYQRWKGHDLQPRPYDNEDQALDRVLRSILSWDACEHAAAQLDAAALLQVLERRETAAAEDMMRSAWMAAQHYFNEAYRN